VRCLFDFKIRDTQCGFKLFRGDVADNLFKKQCLKGFSFDVELLYLAHNLGYKTVEVPINWNDVAGSKVNVLLHSARMFADLLTIQDNWVSGKYNDIDSDVAKRSKGY
jgi:dolichyl-phosphate beta-glucosyltransferase